MAQEPEPQTTATDRPQPQITLKDVQRLFERNNVHGHNCTHCQTKLTLKNYNGSTTRDMHYCHDDHCTSAYIERKYFGTTIPYVKPEDRPTPLELSSEEE